jgi:selenocysteine lyase/cysteine desulfurase
MTTALIEKIRESVIGDKQGIDTCFGLKPLVYADYTASGRSLTFIENFISSKVLPFYANTHTETSFSGAQTTKFREEARNSIRKAVNANSDDQVIFTGSGATAAINKLIDILNLRLPADLSARHKLLDHLPLQDRPVVFIGPYEHHSNEIPWRESIADVVVIPLAQNGQLDIAMLEKKLAQYADRELKIGSFSAASNVTGIKTDVDRVAALLHSYAAFSFWDYAAAAPYVAIDMNPAREECTKDAVFISPHKFVGGPGTPGILVVKKQLLNNSVPAAPGGGTVVYVTPEDHQFIADHQRREEGGTPAIVESIRAGLVFSLQQAVGIERIEELEAGYKARAIKRWRTNPSIQILGNTDEDSLSIFSLRFKYQDKDLHYGYVVALLNDLFGIQARGGCSCAGPYGHELLGMDMAYSRALEKQILQGHMVLRPGWVRLNFNYFIGDETFEYLLAAIDLVATHGWKLLPYYEFDKTSGTWRYQARKMALESLSVAAMFDSSSAPAAGDKPLELGAVLALAKRELEQQSHGGTRYGLTLPAAADVLRWFVLPQDIDDKQCIELAS